MRIVIAGAGRLGTRIARVLATQPNDVTVIDIDQQRLNRLNDGAGAAVHVLHGDACEPGILEQAGAHAADLVIAATGDDEDNLVISLLAKRQFGVGRVAARINDSDNDWLFDAKWGVDVAVPSESPLVSLIQEATGIADTVSLLRLTTAGVNLIETTIEATSRAAHRALSDIDLPAGSVVATIVRAGRPTVPSGQWQLEPGDELLVVSDKATRADIRAAFQ